MYRQEIISAKCEVTCFVNTEYFRCSCCTPQTVLWAIACHVYHAVYNLLWGLLMYPYINTFYCAAKNTPLDSLGKLYWGL